MSDDRSARLRGKRKEAKEKAQSKQSEPSKPSETDESEQTSESDETGGIDEPEQPDESGESDEPEETDESEEADESDRVKDEQVGTYFYLPEGQRDDMRYRYKMLSAEYEREFGEDLEKNRHFYPLIVEYGLERLDSADAQDVRDMLESLDY